MANITIEVLGLEFHENGNTIWVHGKGATVLRIKTLGKIITTQCADNPVSHADIVTPDDIKICLSNNDANIWDVEA